SASRCTVPTRAPTTTTTPGSSTTGAEPGGSVFRFEPDDGQRGERHGQRLVVAVPAVAVGQGAAVDDAAAPEVAGVGVEHLAPPAAPGHADPVALAGDGRQVGDAGQRLALLPVGGVAEGRPDLPVR